MSSSAIDCDLSATVALKERDKLKICIHQWKLLCDNYKSSSNQPRMNCQHKQYGMSQCPCCQRILIIFDYCQQAKTNTIYTDTFGIFPGYNLTMFQNDMDHIIVHHGNEVIDGQFINQIGSCEIQHCRVPARESKNVVASLSITSSTESTKPVLQQITRQLLIEEYHAYLFHHITHKHDTERFGEIYSDRRYRFISKAIELANGQTDIKYQDIAEEDIAEEDIAEEEQQPTYAHSFIPRNINRMTPYVGCKYENLKKELIEDPAKGFNIPKWNILIAISSAVAKKDVCKRLKAKSTKYGWRTQVGKSISIARIVALKLYTDYDALASKLCEVHRIVGRKKKKQAHSRFAHWAKLLTSTIDIYGQKMKKCDLLFRGLSGKSYMNSLLSTDFNAPTSTTLSAKIARQFAFDGIIIQIEKPHWKDGARFINMTPFSAFKHEKESLFYGRDNFLKMKSIKPFLSLQMHCYCAGYFDIGNRLSVRFDYILSYLCRGYNLGYDIELLIYEITGCLGVSNGSFIFVVKR